MPVSPDMFTSAMSIRWQALQLVPSPALRSVWSQMAVTFNRQIAAYGTPDGDRWQVLQPPTGTGKTQGLAVYCSLLPVLDHPGVLIVTRLKEQANGIAQNINQLAGQEVARAYHTDRPATPEELSASPVLIITHRAYEIGLDRISRGDPMATCWSRFHRWVGGRRKLVVIDEALDVVEEAQVDLKELKVLLAILPPQLLAEFPRQKAALEFTVSILEATAVHEDTKDTPSRERLLNQEEFASWSAIDMAPIRRALRALRLDHHLLREHDVASHARQVRRFDKLLNSVEVLLSQWRWYAKKRGEHTINSARLILPEEGCGAVILDATASQNLVYQLFGDRVSLIPIPAGSRSYANVTLHVSLGHSVGKGTLRDSAKEERGRLVQSLKKVLPADRKVFVCCHKVVEPHLVDLGTGFSAFDVGHWQAIDGRNDWDSYDTAVIFGLPYRDNIWSANTYMAIRGVQSEGWLNADGDRPFGVFKDIRRELEVGQLVVSIVQAINRIHCRRVVDGDGNCPPSDVFILLPDGEMGEKLLNGIRTAMPHIRVVEWPYQSAKKRVRRSGHEEALVRFASTMMLGRWAISEIAQELSIPKRSKEWLMKRLKDATSDVCTRLQELGIRYEVVGFGRGARSYLVKA